MPGTDCASHQLSTIQLTHSPDRYLSQILSGVGLTNLATHHLLSFTSPSGVGLTNLATHHLLSFTGPGGVGLTDLATHHLLAHSFTHSPLPHSLSHSSTHSLTHSLTIFLGQLESHRDEPVDYLTDLSGKRRTTRKIKP